MDKITLALPSKGAIAEPTYGFLKDCGLRIHKPNARQYTGSIPAVPTMDILFQRVKDIVYKVSDGTAQLGITGLDVVRENPHQDLITIHDSLGYGHCQLIVAVPEAWVDVVTMADILDISLDFRQDKQRNLRVATTYPHLTRQFLHQHGIHHFTVVKAEGAIEAAPTIGYADIIVDLTQTGTTLRENHLKIIKGSVIVDSQACLIGNKRILRDQPQCLETLRTFLEYVDASMNGKQYSHVTVNIHGESINEVGAKLMQSDFTRGLQGPTISRIADGESNNQTWYTVTLILKTKKLMPAIEYLRDIGSTQIVTAPVNYVFLQESPTYIRLLDALN